MDGSRDQLLNIPTPTHKHMSSEVDNLTYHNVILVEIPSVPCSSFYNRDDYLLFILFYVYPGI